MKRIFISYRRNDTHGVVGRLYDHLTAAIGTTSVFLDIDSIPVGIGFREHIENSVKDCDFILVPTGQNWTGPLPNGEHRIQDPNDFVRNEIEIGLNLGIPVVPLLISGSTLPPVEILPESLRPLHEIEAVELDPEWKFQEGFNRLLQRIDCGKIKIHQTALGGQYSDKVWVSLGFCMPFALGLFPLGIIMGHAALREIKKRPELKGKWIARIALLIGYSMFIYTFFLVISYYSLFF